MQLGQQFSIVFYIPIGTDYLTPTNESILFNGHQYTLHSNTSDHSALKLLNIEFYAYIFY